MASIKSTSVHAPQFQGSLSPESLEQLDKQEEYAAIKVSNSDLSGQNVKELLFEEASFHHTLFTGSRLPKLRLFDVRMEACDLSGAFLEEARLRRVEFIGCRLLGAQLLSAQLDDVYFKECNLEGAVFVTSQAKVLHFEDCVLRNASFEGAKLKGAIFRDCDLRNADLRNADLKQADIRGSKLDGVQVSPKDMGGAIISPLQAVQTVSLLGVTVMDEDE